MDAKLPPDEHIVCRCYVVTEQKILDAIRAQKLRQVEDVTACTNVGGGCGSCYDDIQVLIDGVWGTKRRASTSPVPSGVSNTQKRMMVLNVVRDRVQSILDRNGLELHVLAVEGDRVLARFKGPAVGTQLPSYLSIKWYFVRAISEACGEKMQLVELNVLESRTTTLRRA